MINHHIAWQDFILNDLFDGVRNPSKIFNLLANRFLRSLQWRHTSTNRKLHRSFTNAAECKYKFVHTELVQVSMILNGSAHGFIYLIQSLKFDPGTHKKLCMLNVIKQLQHFILCNMMCYGALISNIDCGLRLWSILLFSAP